MLQTHEARTDYTEKRIIFSRSQKCENRHDPVGFSGYGNRSAKSIKTDFSLKPPANYQSGDDDEKTIGCGLMLPTIPHPHNPPKLRFEMSTRPFRRGITLSLTIAIVVTATIHAHAQGILITGVGPVNRSMAGAGTAAPLDAIGALHWNPGSISALPRSELAFGTELLLADIDLSSSIGGVNAKTSGEAGVAVIPSVGWVHHVEDSPTTIGLGVYGIGGFRNNMPRDPNNTLLSGPPFAGPLFADAEFLQIAPTVSFALSDRLAIGIAPTITTGRLTLDPLGPSVVTPAPTPGTGNRMHWGAGVQVGLYYQSENNWNLGFTIKSPQWFEEFRFFTPGGVTTFDLDLPMILSLGAAYTGRENWIFAVDVRYFDYDNTDGFSEFGWSNVFAAAIGAQYSVNECWDVRFGYNFNQNPISANDAFTNIADPLIQEQNVSLGMSYHLTDHVDLSMAYVYLVNNSLTGPLPAPFGPTDTLSHEIDAHSAIFGISVGY